MVLEIGLGLGNILTHFHELLKEVVIMPFKNIDKTSSYYSPSV